MKLDRIQKMMVGCAMLCVTVVLQGCSTGNIASTDPGRQVVVLPPAQESRSAEAQVRMLNLRIQSEGADAAGKTVADLIAAEVSSKVLAQGFTVTEGTPDVLVGLRGAVNEFDRSGNYYRHDGTLDATVSMPRVGRQVGTQRFTERGDRKLGEADSLREVATKMAGPASAWLTEVGGNISRDIVATDLNIQRTGAIARLTRTAREEDSKYASMFAEVVGGLDGVISCELVQQDYQNRLMVFRIVHYRKEFPAGLLNRLVGIGRLGLKP